MSQAPLCEHGEAERGAPEAKDRVRLVNLKDGKQLERDGDHRVVIHAATLRLE